ncbi:MAG: hypothetical protein AB7N54_01780 [Alphaproteobacteria bacterium]
MTEAETLLREIGDFCRRTGMAESTFGRHAVNDGKLVTRLRYGGRVTTRTVERVRDYMIAAPSGGPLRNRPNGTATAPGNGTAAPVPHAGAASAAMTLPTAPSQPTEGEEQGERTFRFYDNRQKYLLFVHTCGEKWVVADRVGMELQHLHPQPPALRVFDAGMGDGTVLTRVMRKMHTRYPTMPFYITGKEISLEDVRLTLEKMPDRFYEHPATVLVVTNLYYTEAPWLTPRSLAAAASLEWHEVPLQGTTAHEFEQQITALQPFLAQNWNVRRSAKTGNPLYERPTVLVLYRDDYRFMLDQVIPHPGRARADYDLVIASQPYRARMPVDFKAEKVVAPLAKALAPGGRLIGIHSSGGDPGMEVIRNVWPQENPFADDRHAILKSAKAALGAAGRDLNFNAYADRRSIFRYDMHTLPREIGAAIGTSTLFAAWNAAIYVAQIEDERLADVISSGQWLEATRDVLQRHGGLWFNDESFVISRRRD